MAQIRYMFTATVNKYGYVHDQQMLRNITVQFHGMHNLHSPSSTSNNLNILYKYNGQNLLPYNITPVRVFVNVMFYYFVKNLHFVINMQNVRTQKLIQIILLRESTCCIKLCQSVNSFSNSLSLQCFQYIIVLTSTI